MLPVLLLLSCGPGVSDSGAAGGGGTDSGSVHTPTLATSGCGGAAYDWVSLDQTGTVVDSEQASEWSIDAAAVQSLAGLAGVQDRSRLVYDVEVHRVRYTTQDRGRVVEATGLVALPVDGPATATSLLYLHPTTGFEDFCAPSGRDLIWAAVPIVMASQGYAVAAPDYLGQNGFGAEAGARHPYLVAEATAVASLDALRAMWAFTDGGASQRTLLLGASQGGGAALWAERYAADLAPDAEIVGSVVSVPLAELSTWAEGAVSELSVASVGLPLTLASMVGWYGLDADLAEVIPAGEVDRLEAVMAGECPESALPDDVDGLDDIFQAAFVDAVTTDGDWDPWRCMLGENSLSTSPVPAPSGAPLLLVVGGADEVALTAQERMVHTTLCDAGQPVVAVECEGLGHIDTVQATLDRQLDFLAARDAGEALGDACGAIEVIDCEE